MHEALLLPNAEPNEAYHVVAQISEELTKLDAHVETVRSAIALVFDYESEWAWNIQPHGQDFSYLELVMTFYRGPRRAGLSVDLIPPASEAVVGRKLVLLPGLFAPRAELVEALAKCGAVILMGPRSGSKTADFHIPANLPPGSLSTLIDVKVRHVESLRPGIVIPIAGCDTCHFEGWREFLVVGEGVEAVLKSADGEIALARNNRHFYLAGRPNKRLLDDLLCRLSAQAGISPLDLPEDIRIRDNGAIRFVFNYGREAVDISKIIGNASLLLGGDSFHLVVSQFFNELCRGLRVRRGRRPNKEFPEVHKRSASPIRLRPCLRNRHDHNRREPVQSQLPGAGERLYTSGDRKPWSA